MLSILALSSFAAGFIIGAVVVDRFHSKRGPSPVQPVEQNGNPVDLFPCEARDHWSVK